MNDHSIQNTQGGLFLRTIIAVSLLLAGFVACATGEIFDGTLDCSDSDTDGYGDQCSAGEDCDDNDASVYQLLTGYTDTDGDGHGTGAVQQVCSGATLPAGFSGNAGDCDDNDPTRWNDCSGCIDADSDGYGDGCPSGADCDDNDADNWISCATCQDGDIDGWFVGCDSYTVRNGMDCNDEDGALFQLLTGYTDTDGDGFGTGAAQQVCSGAALPSGFAAQAGDCDDNESWAFPGGTETCDTINNDCDANTDEGCDNDSDNYCDEKIPMYRNNSMCVNTPFITEGQMGDDCNDESSSINPGVNEICGNSVDEDCDGSLSNGCGGPICGQNGCEEQEDCTSCEADCGACPTGTIYYVSNSGHDSNNGCCDPSAGYTDCQGCAGTNGPWKTMARINSHALSPKFSSGDAIKFKRGDEWRNDETVGWNHAEDRIISFANINGLLIEAYGSGPKPWIDCSTQNAVYFYGNNVSSNLVIRNLDVSGLGPLDAFSLGTITPYPIYVRGFNNITLDSIYADGHKGSPIDFHIRGTINIGPYPGDLVIKNSEIFNIKFRDTLHKGTSPWLVIVMNTYHIGSQAKTDGSISILNNIVHDVAGDILQPANNRPAGGFLIKGNLFYHFAENAIDFKSAANVIVEDNEIYRDFGGSNKYCEDHWPNNLHNFAFIVMHTTGNAGDPGCSNITIRNNYLHSAGDFLTIRGGSNGLDVYNNYFKDIGKVTLSSQNCSVHDNIWDVTHDPVCDDFIYCGPGTSACSASTLSLLVPTSSTINCTIRNNTFYTRSDTINYQIYYNKYDSSTNNEIYDNLFYMDRDSTAVYPFYLRTDTNNTNFPDVYGNVYYNPQSARRVYWDNTFYNQDQQSAYRNDGHPGALFVDPMFVDPANGDFHLQPGSPAAGKGSGWFPNLGL